MSTSTVDQQSSFKPWRKNFTSATKYGLVACASLGLWYLSHDNYPQFGYACLAGVFFSAPVAYSQAQIGFIRLNGKFTEQSAIKNIMQILPAGWLISANELRPGIGDVDLIITTDQEKKIAVEIKSIEGLKKTFWTGTLLRANGKPVGKDIVGQLNKQCLAINASLGILWLPKAKTKNYFKFKDYVVVNGNHKQLLRVIKKFT